jgi:Fe-S cluster biogenesis protein NfuA
VESVRLILDNLADQSSFSLSALPLLPFPSLLLARTLFVQTQTTPNVNSLQFIPGVPVLSSGGTHEFLTPKSALSSPLALRLMGIDGVQTVFYGPDFVSVLKDEDTPWSLIKPEVFSLIMEHFASGAPLFKEGSKEAEGEEDGEPADTRINDEDSEVLAMVKELLATRIRPSIMEDGGDLEFMGFGEETDGIVRIKLKGSCRGCSSSAVTLKSGVEVGFTLPPINPVKIDPETDPLCPTCPPRPVANAYALRPRGQGSRAGGLDYPLPFLQTCPCKRKLETDPFLAVSDLTSQILDDEEVIALDEFAKFEAKLAAKQNK